MASSVNAMERTLIVVFSLLVFDRRVCLATPQDFTATTSIGLCSEAVLIVFKVGSQGTVGYTTSVLNTQAKILSWLPTFCNKKQTYPYVDLYLGLSALGTETNAAAMLASANLRTKFVQALVAAVKTYPNCVGLYVDFDGLTTSQSTGYTAFMTALYDAAVAASLKIASALPWNAEIYADIMFSVTLTKLTFNLLKTYLDMYVSEVEATHPIAPLFQMEAPFDDNKSTIFYSLFRWVIKGFNPNNIILGVPMYARTFSVTGVTALGGAGSATSADVSYCSVEPRLPQEVQQLPLEEPQLPLQEQQLLLEEPQLPLEEPRLLLEEPQLPLEEPRLLQEEPLLPSEFPAYCI
ncbi:AGAP013147-PA-like protein [Anopheles sinensis]|uniref:AGAP013147-PA-like protein n=1 Tax=Anopheles sinensis TaxID=74873 RepID=A0A084VIU9_ANOSI|nr:AGAP013147-PA-like protein [Anopheles sinensis]